MTLREKIDQDFKEAFKAQKEAQVSTLRLLLSSIKNREVEKRTKLSKTEAAEKLEELSKLGDEEIIGVISSEVKKRKDSAEQYKAGNRNELAEKEEAEIKILSVYLPEQLGEDEIRKMVKEAIQKSGAQSQKEMGKVMGILAPQIKGKADGGLVSGIVKEELYG
ncbi:MAG: GatB/YqeY domain-containing protein [Candidatus Portnoybacteria bacterium]|nr:GatB/YqeY domain-containing protein [Candidatus Portnoybacteria bacterium]